MKESGREPATVSEASREISKAEEDVLFQLSQVLLFRMLYASTSTQTAQPHAVRTSGERAINFSITRNKYLDGIQLHVCMLKQIRIYVMYKIPFFPVFQQTFLNGISHYFSSFSFQAYSSDIPPQASHEQE